MSRTRGDLGIVCKTAKENVLVKHTRLLTQREGCLTREPRTRGIYVNNANHDDTAAVNHR